MSILPCVETAWSRQKDKINSFWLEVRFRQIYWNISLVWWNSGNTKELLCKLVHRPTWYICSVQVSCSVVPYSLRPHGLQHVRLPCLSTTPSAFSKSCPLSWWCHPTTSSCAITFSAFIVSKLQGLFQWVKFSLVMAKVLEFQLQHQSFQWIFRTDLLYYWLVWSPCSPRNSQRLFQHHSSKATIQISL